MISFRPHPKIPPSRVPAPRRAVHPPEAVIHQWRAIYALCRPEELRAEDARLAREFATGTCADMALLQTVRLRRTLVQERLAALGAP